MSAATIDRVLQPERAKLGVHGRSHTKPGALLKSQIPIRTWAQWDDKPATLSSAAVEAIYEMARRDTTWRTA